MEEENALESGRRDGNPGSATPPGPVAPSIFVTL